MRLSKRERFLLAVLTLLLLWTGFYKFWIEPETDLLFANLQEINRLEEQIKRGGPQGKQNLEQRLLPRSVPFFIRSNSIYISNIPIIYISLF